MGLVALAVLSALHWYLWRRLVRDTTRPGSVTRWCGTGVIVIGAVLMVAALVGQVARAPMGFVRVVAWPGFLWAALVIYLLIGVLVGELLRPLVMRWYDGVRGDGADSTRTAASAAGEDGPDSAPRSTGSPTTESVDPATAEPVRAVEDSATDPDPIPASAANSQAGPTTEAGTGDAAPVEDAKPVSRRLFVSRVLGGAAIAAAVGTVGLGTYNVLSGPAVKRMTVLLPKLPPEADGFRITLVSDLHVGPALGRSFTQRVVDAVNGTQPDLIAVAGDLVDGRVADLRSTVAPLADLRSRLGTYYVTGNHEYYSGADEWIAHVQELGMRVLMNSRVEVEGFDLAGVDDIEGEAEGRGPDVAAALAGRDPARAVILLAHQPVVIHDAVDHGVDLQLSGHTHGGQLFPGNLIAELANPTLAGLERYGDTQLYVTRGAGAWGPPVRVAAPSDITVLELRTVRDRISPSPR
ncbi:metallophosphoesterase [Nocardia cyriacigeorgica]|uniref:Metallophosphoesterase n=1 Tax=Nocardia cyriacigeorgica TaxID=135487 RepID=A0A6P1D591_9NOCA|nr:metallophosphoesterase [Nocardia cyriacigeorgica]NEW39966.1 metallophosphoesterase [Nocardia cyriacigeorgica]NEW45218.1 metallophosphoesterase [Nocardia cyriacigeorgica]NEW51449.1 metallophosphoesterase [Nocardia cyriacigeorgica]NEW55315.1 metallophosphoesterase [Nocardia cyriacigeorgica]